MRPDELERRLRKRLDALGPAPRAGASASDGLSVLLTPTSSTIANQTADLDQESNEAQDGQERTSDKRGPAISPGPGLIRCRRERQAREDDDTQDQ